MKEEKAEAPKVADPADEIPIKPLGQAKDPFADAYAPGEGPPPEMNKEILTDMRHDLVEAVVHKDASNLIGTTRFA